MFNLRVSISIYADLSTQKKGTKKFERRELSKNDKRKPPRAEARYRPSDERLAEN